MGDFVCETGLVDKRLPERLFATDRYPDGRLNIYSKPDLLYKVRKSLEDTDQWNTLVQSCFWPLFNLPLGRCGLSSKLIHGLVSRQLDTAKKYELWTVFGGHPMRFSLSEFGSVTGLPCGDFPDGYNPYCDKSEDVVDDTYWKDLLGDVDPKTTPLTHVSDLLEKCLKDEGPRKLRLALLLIVDGVLIASNQTPRPTPKYVEMLRDVNSFMAFPWGRESFFKTIAARPLFLNLATTFLSIWTIQAA